jgi:hypothetical protein
VGVAEDLYTALTAAEIERYVAGRIPEKPHLDYKSSSDFVPKQNRGDYRAKSISRPLGGFANSLTGGVLVYGIKCHDTEKTPEGYDIPIEIEPDAPGLYDAISDLAVSGVSPPISGLVLKHSRSRTGVAS